MEKDNVLEIPVMKVNTVNSSGHYYDKEATMKAFKARLKKHIEEGGDRPEPILNDIGELTGLKVVEGIKPKEQIEKEEFLKELFRLNKGKTIMKEVINLEVTSYLSNIFNKGFNLGETTLCNTLTKDSSLLLTVRTMIDLVNSNKDSFESNAEVPVLVISKYPAHEIIKLIADEIVKLYPEYEDSVTHRDVLVKFTENTPYEIYASQIEKLNSPITLGNDIRMIFIPEYDAYNNSGFEREFLRRLRNHCNKNGSLLFLTKVRNDVRRFDLSNNRNLDIHHLTQEVDRFVWVEMKEDSSGVTRAKARILKHRNPEPIPYEHIELVVDPSGSCLVNKRNQ